MTDDLLRGILESKDDDPRLINAKILVAEAQAALIAAETHGQLLDNRTATALALTAELSARREAEAAEWDLVSNRRVREYHFTSVVDTEQVDQAIDTLTRWDRIDGPNGASYKIVICSPGGSVVHGMKLYSTIKAVASRRPVITVASGVCASMATIIHQAGSLRVIEPGCSYLIHDVSGESFGTIGSMEDTMKWMTKLNSTLHRALAEKANISLEEVAALGKRQDGWFMPEEILAFGLADVIEYAMNAHPGMPIPKVEAAHVDVKPVRKPRAKKDTTAPVVPITRKRTPRSTP